MAKEPKDPVSDEAMEKLARLMNDSPTIMKLKGTEWEIRCLKPGAQWMIAEEACKIVRGESSAMGDVVKEFANNLPSVARVLAIALLNDKDRIENDLQKVYDALMWGDFDMRDWTMLLYEVLRMIDVDFFFASTDVIVTVREMTLKRKMTTREQKSSLAERNGGK